MDEIYSHGLTPAEAEMIARSLAEIGTHNPARLTLEDIQSICRILSEICNQKEDIVLQNRFPSNK